MTPMPLEPVFLLQPVQAEVAVAAAGAMSTAIVALFRLLIKTIEQRSANDVERLKADYAVAEAIKELAGLIKERTA